MEIQYLIKGDTGSQLKVYLIEDETGLAVDCTNETVRLHFRKKNTTIKLFSLTSLVEDSQSLSEGLALFDFENNLITLDAGYYSGEVEIENNTTNETRTVYERIPFTVRDEIG